jgi:hypothetical protein
MLAVAAELDRLTLLLAVLATVFSMSAAFFDHTAARRVGALGNFGHRSLLA